MAGGHSYSFTTVSLVVFISLCMLPVIMGDSKEDNNVGGGLTAYEKNYTRSLDKLVLNPYCPKDSWCKNESYPGGVLSYTVARGPKDDLHHLFSTIGAPTLMITRTHKNTNITIDYSELMSQNESAINYTAKPQHSLGMIFSALYEYEDYNDTADLSNYHNNHTNPGNYSTVIKHKLTNLNWHVAGTHGDTDYQEITVNATRHPSKNSSETDLFKQDGYLSFIIRYDTKDGRLKTRPHMEYTSNSSMVTVVMSNLTTTYNRSRFALEMIMFSTESDTVEEFNSTQVHNFTSMDDEYSPGVFQMRNWYANDSKPRDMAWGYAQWKPVVYTSTDRKNQDLSHATSYPNLPFNQHYITHNHMPSRSLFRAYFFTDYSELSLNATNVSFGVTQDGFFKNTEYLVWTMSVGMGPAPEDDVSLTVILVIAVGLGIPVVLMLFSVIYVCVKNMRKRRAGQSAYTAINE